MADHDHPYKLLFSHPEMVRDLLVTFVKEDWVRDLDFSTLQRRSGSFVSDDLRDREDDLVWSVRWGSRQLYVYLLIEFQSSVDRYMAVRLMTYLGLLYQDLVRTGGVNEGERLPAVLPVVLYNGKPVWTAPRDIRDLIELVPGGLERYRPSFEYLLIDEVRCAGDELIAARNPVAALFRLEQSREPEDVREVLHELVEWLRAPAQIRLRRDFTVWFARTFLPGRAPGQSVPEFHDLQEVDAMLSETVVEWTKRWKEEGRIEGKIEGELKGEIKGKLEGKLEEKRDVARRMRDLGLDPDIIFQATGLRVEELD